MIAVYQSHTLSLISNLNLLVSEDTGTSTMLGKCMVLRKLSKLM